MCVIGRQKHFDDKKTNARNDKRPKTSESSAKSSVMSLRKNLRNNHLKRKVELGWHLGITINLHQI